MVKNRIFSKSDCIKASALLSKQYGEKVKVVPIQDVVEPEDLPDTLEDFDGVFMYKSSDGVSRFSLRGKFADSFARKLLQEIE